MKIIFGPFFLTAFAILGTFGLFFPAKGIAALNGGLSGSIEGAYLYQDFDRDGVKSSSRGIEQRYNLRISENLLDSRLGFISGGVSWTDDQTSYSGETDQARRSILKDYNINLSLLPMISPLTLFAQKTERENQFDLTLRDTITTYGFGWYYSPVYLPRIGINGIHTTYSSDQSGLFPNTETDFLTVETGGRWRDYNLSARYLYNQSQGDTEGSTWAHGVNLNLNGALTRSLTVGLYGSYASRGGNVSGMNFFQENALGANLYYNPNRFMDGNLRFDFNESPGTVDFKRYLTSGGLNFHFTGKLDWFNSGQITRFESGSSQTDSLFASSTLNYRPIFGLNLSAGVGGGETQITGGGFSSTSKQWTGNGSVSYFKAFPLLRLNGGYAGSYAWNHSELLGESTDTTHTISGGIDNTQTAYLHVGLNGSMTIVNRTVPSQSDDQHETRISATADTHYFRNLIFFNDTLLLDGTVTYLDVTGFGVAGETLSEDFHATYQFLSMFSLLGYYSHIDYPVGYYGGNSNIWSLEGMGTVRPWINGLWTFGLRDLINEREDQYTQKTLDGQTKLSHQLGRLTLSTEYHYLKSETGPINAVSQQFLVRAIRPF